MTKKRVPWNKGKKTPDEVKKKISESKKGTVPWNKGVKCTDEHKKKISEGNKGRKAWNKGVQRTWESPTEFKKGENIGEDNHKWKGDSVSYRNLHRWIERNLGKASKCEYCGKEGVGREIHWANKNHLYKRNLEDWTQLCVKCHAKHDKLLRSKNGVNSGNIQNGQS